MTGESLTPPTPVVYAAYTVDFRRSARLLSGVSQAIPN